MSHNIQCIIGPKGAIVEIVSNWRQHKLDLNAEFSLIPLTHDFICDVNELVNKGEQPVYKEFWLLSSSLHAFLKGNSYSEPIGYIETDYKGEEGTQSAIAYHKGEVIVGPLKTKTQWDNKEMSFIDFPMDKRAINIILYALGLEERHDMDGFENLTLGNYHSNKAILNQKR